MNAGIDTELAGLFGRWTLAAAQVRRLDDLKVDLDAVKAAAHRIIQERGHPERQRAIVDALDDDTAVALCIWLRDPANAAGLLKQARAKARKRGEGEGRCGDPMRKACPSPELVTPGSHET
jgi:hypothetical protein